MLPSRRGSGVRLYEGLDLQLFILVGWAGAFCLLLGPPGSSLCFSFAPGFRKLFSIVGQLTESVDTSGWLS